MLLCLSITGLSAKVLFGAHIRHHLSLEVIARPIRLDWKFRQVQLGDEALGGSVSGLFLASAMTHTIVFSLEEGAAPCECLGVRRPLLGHLLKHWRLDAATVGELEEDIGGVAAARQARHGDPQL